MSKLYLLRLIQSRERASNTMFVTKQELEQYVESSTSSVYYLLLKIVGVENMNADHAISHMAKAQGICNMLRTVGVAYQSGLGALPAIPQDVLLAQGCSYERILRHRADDVAVQNCIFDVASIANIHLEKSRNLSDKVPAKAKPIFLPAVAIGRFLERLRRANFQLNDPSVMKRDSFLPLVIYWKRFRKTY